MSTPITDAPRLTCFVDMPFGRKMDAKSGVEIDFDQVYAEGIEPAVRAAKIEPIRGDREQTGGIIHVAMFARLLLAEFVIADMTSANANVFYELGVRHAARPYTTIALYATLGVPPFDVGMVRAIPYELTDGILGADAAKALGEAIGQRIRSALTPPAAHDSPLFQLFEKFPGITVSPDLGGVFRERIDYARTFRTRLATARAIKPTKPDAVQALKDIEASLGDIATAERSVLFDLLLSYRAVEAASEMVDLVGRMSAEARDAPLTRQQLAFALNRRNGPGDRDRAVQVLQELLHSHGDSAETLGLLGRTLKDRYRAAAKAGSPDAAGWLDEAIAIYTRGYEADPLDFYPGINALTLLILKDGNAAKQELRRLTPLVTFAALRRGGDKSADYWTVATVLELACLNCDEALARRCVQRARMLAGTTNESWMLATTADNLALISKQWSGKAKAAFIPEVEAQLRAPLA